MDNIDIRFGPWQESLGDLNEVECIVTDPPYSAKTHKGHGDMAADVGRQDLSYRAWGQQEIFDFVDYWAPRTTRWFCVLTSHDLYPLWEEFLSQHGWYTFAPVPCIYNKRPRFQGDGPASWATWLFVARRRSRESMKWASLPGAYIEQKRQRPAMVGGKPPWLMDAIIRDYSKPGDLICDPCAGMGTTLLSAAHQDRIAVGAEQDRETYEKAKQHIALEQLTAMSQGVGGYE